MSATVFCIQELRQFIVLVMELCDYDLDHLVKVDPFNEESTIVFLHQLGKILNFRALDWSNRCTICSSGNESSQGSKHSPS